MIVSPKNYYRRDTKFSLSKRYFKLMLLDPFIIKNGCINPPLGDKFFREEISSYPIKNLREKNRVTTMTRFVGNIYGKLCPRKHRTPLIVCTGVRGNFRHRNTASPETWRKQVHSGNTRLDKRLSAVRVTLQKRFNAGLGDLGFSKRTRLNPIIFSPKTKRNAKVTLRLVFYASTLGQRM